MSHQKRHHSTQTGISFDPAVYPRTYSISAQYQTFRIMAGLAFAIGFPFLLWQSHGANTVQKVLPTLPMALLGGYLVLEAYKLKLILESDAILVCGYLRSQLPVSGLVGLQEWPNSQSPVIPFAEHGPFRSAMRWSSVLKGPLGYTFRFIVDCESSGK